MSILLVGHGKSSGARAWVVNYDVYTAPIKAHIEETATKFPGKKVFIYGHSMVCKGLLLKQARLL